MRTRRDSWTLQLSQTAEYALRALAHLATQDEGVAVNARELSQGTGVPVHYLSKVMRRLVTAGLVHASRGHGGGFVLARPAAEILLGDVLAAGEHNPASPDRCAFGWGTCDAKRPCPLHGTWSELKEAAQAWARRTTLADVSRYAAVHADPLRARAPALVPPGRLSRGRRRR